MRYCWRVLIPHLGPNPPRCVHGEVKGQCIKNSHCPVRKQVAVAWKWMAEFRYKRDATRYAKCLEGAKIVADEIV